MRVAALTLAAVFFVWTSTSASAQALPGTTPQTVIEAFEQARSAGDLDSALAQFEDDAVIALQGSASVSYHGKDQVRTYLHTFGVQYRTVLRSTPEVQGNTVTWTEHDEIEHHAWDMTVLAVVRSGYIASLWYHQSEPGSVAPQATGQRRPGELPAVTWLGLLGLLGMLLLGLVSRRPRQHGSASQLDGRLLRALRSRHERRAA